MKRLMPMVVVGMVIGLCPSAGGSVGRVSHERHCPPAGRGGSQSLAEARRVRRFPLFWAGRTLGRHLRLAAVVCSKQSVADAPVIHKDPSAFGTIPSWSFFYGRCTPARGSDAGCVPPVEIRSDGSCWNNLGLFFKGERPTLIRLRGVRVGLFPGGGEPHIKLYTKQTTITIFANTIAQARRIARVLRSVDGRYPTAGRLPPASPRTLAGKMRCTDVAPGSVHG